MALNAVEAIRQLQDRSSAKRRSAAKRLRKLGDPDAGPALLEALKNEVRDSRTWETQYQMTMALGTCGSPSDLPYLRDLVLQRETLHAVHTAGGDAIIRLSYMEHSPTEAIRWCLSTSNETLVGGALQDVAMIRLVPDQETVTYVLDFIEAGPRTMGSTSGPLLPRPAGRGSECTTSSPHAPPAPDPMSSKPPLPPLPGTTATTDLCSRPAPQVRREPGPSRRKIWYRPRGFLPRTLQLSRTHGALRGRVVLVQDLALRRIMIWPAAGPQHCPTCPCVRSVAFL
ncbi:hypothetical protein SHIRM173S_01663 [Streptomyces hirsutus]